MINSISDFKKQQKIGMSPEKNWSEFRLLSFGTIFEI